MDSKRRQGPDLRAVLSMESERRQGPDLRAVLSMESDWVENERIMEPRHSLDHSHLMHADRSECHFPFAKRIPHGVSEAVPALHCLSPFVYRERILRNSAALTPDSMAACLRSPPARSTTRPAVSRAIHSSRFSPPGAMLIN